MNEQSEQNKKISNMNSIPREQKELANLKIEKFQDRSEGNKLWF
jgi:hypothetical protein